uniref:Uncharacterized protein n=1 Tax=Amphimedon queenslandica TaxID=400682 RepID=A0A1X7UH90_AMPQE
MLELTNQEIKINHNFEGTLNKKAINYGGTVTCTYKPNNIQRNGDGTCTITEYKSVIIEGGVTKSDSQVNIKGATSTEPSQSATIAVIGGKQPNGKNGGTTIIEGRDITAEGDLFFVNGTIENIEEAQNNEQQQQQQQVQGGQQQQQQVQEGGQQQQQQVQEGGQQQQQQVQEGGQQQQQQVQEGEQQQQQQQIGQERRRLTIKGGEEVPQNNNQGEQEHTLVIKGGVTTINDGKVKLIAESAKITNVIDSQVPNDGSSYPGLCIDDCTKGRCTKL